MGKNNWLLAALCALALIVGSACGDDSGGGGGDGDGDGDGDGSGGTGGDGDGSGGTSGDGDGDGGGMDAGDNGPAEDPNCPHYIGNVMNMDIDLPGCCADSGQCGVISSISNTCITESTILADLAPGDACGADADAGI